MMASRGCKEELPFAPYDWDPTFKRCPQSLFRGVVLEAFEWWRGWDLVKEGPFAPALADNPAYVKQAVMEFEQARRVGQTQAMEKLSDPPGKTDG